MSETRQQWRERVSLAPRRGLEQLLDEREALQARVEALGAALLDIRDHWRDHYHDDLSACVHYMRTTADAALAPARAGGT